MQMPDKCKYYVNNISVLDFCRNNLAASNLVLYLMLFARVKVYPMVLGHGVLPSSQGTVYFRPIFHLVVTLHQVTAAFLQDLAQLLILFAKHCAIMKNKDATLQKFEININHLYI